MILYICTIVVNIRQYIQLHHCNVLVHASSIYTHQVDQLMRFWHLWLKGFPQVLEIMENLENHQKSSMHGKIMEFEKKQQNNHVK